MKSLVGLFAFALFFALVPIDATAVTHAHGPQACAPSNDSLASNFQYAPWGILNTSASTTLFLHCPMTTSQLLEIDLGIIVFNGANFPQEVTCVLREVDPDLTLVRSITRKTVLDPETFQSQTWFDLSAQELLNTFTISCKLPPFTGLGNSYESH